MASSSNDAVESERVAVKVRDFAAMFDMSERTVWKLIAEGSLPSVKIGHARRVLLPQRAQA